MLHNQSICEVTNWPLCPFPLYHWCKKACRRWIPPVGSSHREDSAVLTECCCIKWGETPLVGSSWSHLTMADPLWVEFNTFIGMFFISWNLMLRLCNKTTANRVWSDQGTIVCFCETPTIMRPQSDNKEHPLVQYDALCAFLLRWKKYRLTPPLCHAHQLSQPWIKVLFLFLLAQGH